MTSDIDGLLADLEAQQNAVVGLLSEACVARAESLDRWIAAVEGQRDELEAIRLLDSGASDPPAAGEDETIMSDVGKQHMDQTTTRWASGLREPDPHGCFVRYCCDQIEACIEGPGQMDAVLQKEMTRRAKKVHLKPLDVWDAFVVLVHALRQEKK